MKQTRYFPLFASLAATAFVILVGIQYIRPELTDPPVQAEIQAPEEVRTILRHSCYNCHSNETKLSWFDRISPAYWFVTQDVRRARQHVNFSEIGALSPQTQKAVLFDAVNQIQFGAMPLPFFLLSVEEESLERLIAPGDRIALESDNQKQTDS